MIESGHSPKNGTGQKKEESGTQSMVKKCLAIFQCLPGPVSSVKKNTKQKNDQGLGSVVTTANQHKDEKMAQTWKSELVSSAQLLMRLTSIQAKKLVGQKPVYVVSVQKREKAPVYNLTVQDQHEYYANGVLTHNCDATRYMVINFLDIMQTRTNSNVSAQNTILGRGSDSLASFSQDMGLWKLSSNL